MKGRFDNAKNDLEKGSLIIAEKEFRLLIKDLEKESSDECRELLFRSKNNLGITLYYLDKSDEASILFDEAFEMKPEEIRAKTNKALACFIREDFRGAECHLKRAIETHPNDIDAITHMARVQAELNGPSEGVRFLESHPLTSEEYFIVLANYYNVLGEYTKAEEAANNALKLSPRSIGARVALGNAMGMPIVFRKKGGNIPSFALSDPEFSKVSKAFELLYSAFKKCEESGTRIGVADILINISAYAIASGNPQACLEASQQAVRYSPESPEALNNLYYAQIQLGHYSEAINTARQLRCLEPPSIAIQREIDALLCDDCFKELLKLYEEHNATYPELRKNIYVTCSRIRSLLKLTEHIKAEELLNNALQEFAQDPLIWVEAGSFYEDLNRLEEAESAFLRAHELATDRFAVFSRQQLGLFYLRKGKWQEASTYILSASESLVRCPFRISYVISLYNQKKYAKCLVACKAIIQENKYDEALFEITANCNILLGDLNEAESILTRLVSKSQKVEHWLRLAEVRFRLWNHEKAANTLEQAKRKFPKSYEITLNLSNIRFLQKEYSKAVKLAMEAINMDSKRLEGHGALARCLAIPTDTLSEAEINAIQKSISYLLQNEGSGFTAIPLDQDFKSLRKFLRDQFISCKHIEDIVDEKKLPMAFLAKASGKSLFKTWMNLRNHSQLQINMAQGTPEEQKDELNLASANDFASVDSSALFTLALIDKLELLPKNFKKIYVATLVFENISNELSELSLSEISEGILGYDSGNIVYQPASPDYLAWKKNFLEKLLFFLKSPPVELVGLEPSVWEDQAIQQGMELIGKDVFQAIGVAKGKGIPFYSDDFGIRQMAEANCSIKGFCSQALLRAAQSKGFISESEYNDCLLILFENNYWFISETAETVLRYLEKTKYIVTPLGKKLFSRMSDPRLLQDVSAKILGEVCASLWMKRSRALREPWLDVVLEQLCNVKDFDRSCMSFLGGVAGFVEAPLFFGITNYMRKRPFLSEEQKNKIAYFSLAFGGFFEEETQIPQNIRRHWIQNTYIQLLLLEITSATN